MNNPTLYDRLGLPRDATQDEIRRTYRQLVLHLHPDTNVSQGETELFLDIQQAYERLADPKNKSEYDSQLPEEPAISFPVEIRIQYSQPSLVHISEPQLIYTLLEFFPHPDPTVLQSSTPLNIALVVDCSTSMQGMRLDTVKSTAIDLIRQLLPNDIFSLVKFNDWAELLVPAGSLSDLKSTEMKIQLLQAGGGTEIYKGLVMGFDQVSRFRSRQRVNHIILITDGRTYGDEASCETLADQSAASGIGISALGIGSQWNDRFLDRLASKTGGICKYVPDNMDIRNSILRELGRLGSNLSEQVSFNYHLPQDVELRSAFRLQPDPSPLTEGAPMIFGAMPYSGRMSILLELVIKDFQPELSQITLAEGFINYEIPRHSVKTRFVQRLTLDRRIAPQQITQPLASELIDAVSMVSLYHMQERARDEMGRGDINSAMQQMDRLAAQLASKGASQLAYSVRAEADHIRINQSFSEDGEKRIKYGTRSLLLPARTEENEL